MTPTVYIWKGRKHLIRGIPDKLLAWLVKQLYRSARWNAIFIQVGNTEDTKIALAREVLRREGMHTLVVHAALAIAPTRCKCGGPGLYLSGAHVFCRQCRPKAVSRVMHNARKRNAQDAAFVAEMHERNREYEERRKRKIAKRDPAA